MSEDNIKVDVKEEGRQSAFISHSRVNRECGNEPTDSRKKALNFFTTSGT